MAKQKNIEQLEKARKKLDSAKAVFFVDYQGLTHKQLEEARSVFREIDTDLSIIKNTLVNLALKEKNFDLSDKLHGPFATLFANDDPVKAAKALYAIFKKYNLPKIKFGIFEGKLIDESTIVDLANVESREILLAKFVGLLKSPMSSLVFGLNYNIFKLVFALKEIEKQKNV